jgi:hypothetical protein
MDFSAADNFSFSASQTNQAVSEFISQTELKKAENGYIKDDAVIIEVEIFKISII